jgi:hypothetical protein
MLRPNNSFKPTPLRGGTRLAGKACQPSTATALRGLTQVLGLMRNFLAISAIVLASCSTRMGPSVADPDAATLVTADCDSGGKAVEIFAVTARIVGERLENYGDGVAVPLRLRPGSYEVEALCTRSKTGCGLRHAAIIFTDYAPSYLLKVKGSRKIVADCAADGRDVKFLQ